MDEYLLKKRCTECGEPKSLEEFSPHKRTNDGRCTCCKECRNKNSREKYANGYIRSNQPVHTGLTLRRRMELEEEAKKSTNLIAVTTLLV